MESEKLTGAEKRLNSLGFEKIHIGNLVTTELKKQGITVLELARRVGRTDSPLGRALKQPEIGTKLLRSLSNALGVDFFYLLSIEARSREFRTIELQQQSVSKINEIEAEAERMKAKIHLLEVEVDKEKAVVEALMRIKGGG